MIASEKGGRGAERHRGRSAFMERHVAAAMQQLLRLGGVSASSRTQFVDGVRLHYLTAGRGEVMLLLHGAGGGAANWYRLMGALAERFQVVSIDLPGFGLSDSIEPVRPVGKQIAGLIGTLLDQLEAKPVHVLGTSFGGLVAARIAQISNPRTLTLIDSAGLWPDCSLGLRVVCNRVLQSIPLKQTRRGVRWLFRNVLISTRLDAAHEDALVEYIYASSIRADRRAMARGYSLFAGLRGQYEVLSAHELNALAARTLILWGEQDRFLPAPRGGRADALAAGAQLRIIPRAGHSPTWEAPDAVLNEILSFVK